MKRGICQDTNKRRKRPHESIFWKATFLAFGLCCSINTSDALQVQVPIKRAVDRFDRMDQIGLAEPLRPRTNVNTSLSSQDSKALRAGAASSLVLAIILGLAIKGSQDIGSEELAIVAVSNVIDAAMPSSSTDLVAGAIGESVGGSCGAAATVLLTSLMNVSSNSTKTVTKSEVTNAIADSDFFIVSSASLPLLTAVGLPPALASIGSVVFAAIPSQFVKLGQRQKERQLEEDTVLRELLDEEQLLQKRRRPTLRFPSPFRREKKPKSGVLEDLSPVTTETTILDQVDIFADVTRWLEYKVLKTDFAGTIVLNGIILDPGQTGAVLGIFAAVSSQFYADVLYGRLFEYGPKSKQREVASRSTSEWIKVYASKAASSAALFGVYEKSQIPISRWIQGTLAGGVDGCIGSESFDICLQTYIDSNSPGPSPEAQARALLTNLMMLGQRLEDIAGDTTWDDMNSLLGAWAVSANSYYQHL
jgi:hypothetical protein